MLRRPQHVATLLACVFVGVSCSEVEPGEVIPLAPFAESQVPLSRRSAVALASHSTACVIESYAYRIHCIDRDTDAPVGVFGREGEGPGEFRTPLYLMRGPDETVGAIDIGLGRMTVFEPTGSLVSEVQLPGSSFLPGAHFSSTLIGRTMHGDELRQVELDVASGEVLWERTYPVDLRVASGCAPSVFVGLGGGAAAPGGGMVFPGCYGHLIFFEHRDDDAATIIQAPTYRPELPNQRDVDAYVASTRSSALNFGPSLEDYSRTPKIYSTRRWFDEQGRLWVLTNRGRDEFSYLDIFVGPEYAGTVRVRHRAVGFDVLGSTLAVLVDRPVGPDDSDGFPDRAIDWYDISGLDIGRPDEQEAVASPAGQEQ